MSTTTVESRLREFSQSLIEQMGGIVDWPADRPRGQAMVPGDVARCLGQRDESFPLGLAGGEGGLSLDLGGDFLELAGRALETFVPAQGGFSLANLPVKKTEFERTVDQSFAWSNARCKVVQGSLATLVYHTWWFHVLLRSEDAWESLLSFTINCDNQTTCQLDSLFEAIDLKPARRLARSPSTTLPLAARVVEGIAMREARPFLDRMDKRLERDRQRLRDYYRALLREATTPNRRLKTPPTAEELESRQRAVKLELQRKLGELAERFACDGTARPVALAEFQVPGLIIDVAIQRKSATRSFRLYWNGVHKRLEPLRCSKCGRGAYTIWFTNDAVEPLCPTCHEA